MYYVLMNSQTTSLVLVRFPIILLQYFGVLLDQKEYLINCIQYCHIVSLLVSYLLFYASLLDITFTNKPVGFTSCYYWWAFQLRALQFKLFSSWPLYVLRLQPLY